MIDGLLFFFNDTPSPEIYPLTLHDALRIYERREEAGDEDDQNHEVAGEPRAEHDEGHVDERREEDDRRHGGERDRKSTRLNSSHANISYAVFCLKNKISCFITT